MRNAALRITIALFAASFLMLAGCASQPQWPPISQVASNEHTPGRWVWVELVCDDVEQAKAFYSAVFSWQFDTIGDGADAYTVVRSADRRIGGIVHQQRRSEQTRAARWLASMSVADVKAAAAQVKSAGGDVVIAPRSLAGRGEVAVFSDPEGALFAVIRSFSGDPPQAMPAINAWMWLELWAQDPQRMSAFYRGLGGYTLEHKHDNGMQDEIHLVLGEDPRAGIVAMPRDGLPSTWLPYVRVADLDATLKRVTDAGGYVAVAPGKELREGMVAVIVDPLGGALGVAQWPVQNGEGAGS